MLSIIYWYDFVDTYFVCGDLNSRIGNKKDYIEGIDCVNDRKSIDSTCNSHGENFLDFFKDSNSLILNGRITSELDNFTCVSGKGKSVVDYIVAPFDSINNCKQH